MKAVSKLLRNWAVALLVKSTKVSFRPVCLEEEAKQRAGGVAFWYPVKILFKIERAMSSPEFLYISIEYLSLNLSHFSLITVEKKKTKSFYAAKIVSFSSFKPSLSS